MVHIYIDTYRCNQCGSCVEMAPEVFTMDEMTEMVSTVTDEIELTESVERTVAMCPTQCIEIQEA